MAAPNWALNSAQWIRTALTDIMHAIGQAEAGGKSSLVQKYKALAKELVAQESHLMQKYGVPPATGVGRRKRKDKNKANKPQL